MDRRKFMGVSAATLALGLTGAGGSEARRGPDKKPHAKAGSPNFLFFIADDCMFRTINAINNPEVSTPNLDILVHKGMHFTHCFHAGAWNGAVCISSRTMLNTGLTPFKAQHALSDMRGPRIPMWGETLRRAGYKTFLAGKWHLDYISLSRAFTETKTVAPGFLNSVPSMYNRPGKGNTWSPTDPTLKGHWLEKSEWLDPADTGTKHSSEMYADSAIAFLQDQRGDDQPFFAYIGFNAPHDPRQAPEAFQAKYTIENIHVPPNFLPEHPFDQGDYHTRDEQLAPFPRTEFAIQTHRKEYYAMISHMDEQIGRVVEALEKTGRADNTYIVFTADHGLAVGEHGLMGKQNQYECSMRMPLIMKGPGIASGKVVDEMVYQHSMYATTCELAGVPIPPHVGFPSLKQMIFSETPEPLHDQMFGWLNMIQRSIRTRQYKLIFYVGIQRYQLFDIVKDPWEMHDLSDDPDFASVREDMIGRLKKQQAEWGDDLSLDHPPVVPPGDSY